MAEVKYSVKSSAFIYLFFMHFSSSLHSPIFYLLRQLGYSGQRQGKTQTGRLTDRNKNPIIGFSLQESYQSMAAASAFAVRGRVSQNPFSPLLNILEDGSQNFFTGFVEGRTTSKRYIYLLGNLQTINPNFLISFLKFSEVLES